MMEDIMKKFNYTFHFHSTSLFENLKGNEYFHDISSEYDAVVADVKYPHIRTDLSKGLVWFEAGDEDDFENKIIESLNRIHTDKAWHKIKVFVVGDADTFKRLAKFLNTVDIHGNLNQVERDKHHSFITGAMDIDTDELQERHRSQTRYIYQRMIKDPWNIDYVYATDWSFHHVSITTTTLCTGSVRLNPRYSNYTLAVGKSNSKPSVVFSPILGHEYSLTDMLKLAFENIGANLTFLEHMNMERPPLDDTRPHHLRVK